MSVTDQAESTETAFAVFSTNWVTRDGSDRVSVLSKAEPIPFSIACWLRTRWKSPSANA